MPLLLGDSRLAIFLVHVALGPLNLQSIGWQTFSLKGQIFNNSLDFAGHKASVATTQLCCSGTKATTGNM